MQLQGGQSHKESDLLRAWVLFDIMQVWVTHTQAKEGIGIGKTGRQLNGERRFVAAGC
jgi:hypothetical protein